MHLQYSLASAQIQDSLSVAQLQDSLAIRHLETYVEVLERANEQLSHSWTPLNTIIAALAVLIAAGAILAAILLYLQGREFRDRRDRMFEDAQERMEGYEEKLEDLMESMRTQQERMERHEEALVRLDPTNLKPDSFQSEGNPRGE